MKYTVCEVISMKRSKKAIKISGINVISLICLITIVSLSFTGISYAYWNDNLSIQTLIKTGNIDTGFRSEENKRALENLRTEFFDDNQIIFISTPTEDGVEEGFTQKLVYTIENKGTVPVRFREINKLLENDIVENIEVVNGNQIVITINAKSEGNHKFKYELLFEQMIR